MKTVINQITAAVSFRNNTADNLYKFSNALIKNAFATRVFTLLVCLLYCCSALPQTTYYVKPGGDDANSGTSWIQAFKNPQKALAASISGDIIWVAAGTYYPDEGSGLTNNDRTASFNLKSGVAIYGGFAGTETDLSQRVLKNNPTILSGEIQQDNDNTNNANHVVQANGVDATAILDGFIITDGYSTSQGGGMFNTNNANPVTRNCVFSNNYAPNGGGGVFNTNSSQVLPIACSIKICHPRVVRLSLTSLLPLHL